jgi:hypothetical protein
MAERLSLYKATLYASILHTCVGSTLASTVAALSRCKSCNTRQGVEKVFAGSMQHDLSNGFFLPA